MRKNLPWVMTVLLAGCGPDSVVDISEAEDATEGLEVYESELNTTATLGFLNGADLTVEALSHGAGLDGRVAWSIFNTVAGPDTMHRTADDVRITSIAQLDAIPHVGPASIARIDAYVAARYGAGSASIEGVAFSSQEAADAVLLANSAAIDKVALAASAHDNIVSNRPFTTVAQIAAVPYVGAAALTKLRDYVRSNVVTTGPVTCNGTGGTYDGSVFSKAEECHAVAFINKARWSQMFELSDSARAMAYECSPGAVCGFRTSRWTNLKDFSNRAGIGAVAMKSLKAGAASWTASGLPYDTIAATWANRTAMNGKPVYFDKVFITKRLPDRGSPTWYTWQCAEFRDSPTAPNFIAACYQVIGADSAPECGNGGCLDGMEGKWVSMRGNFVSSAEGWKVNISHRRLGSPNPNVP